ncbi:MAG: hypothetical protein WDN30_12505 [Pararobbsia sp.]
MSKKSIDLGPLTQTMTGIAMKTRLLAAASLLVATMTAQASTSAAAAPKPPAAKAPAHAGPWTPYPAQYARVKVKHPSK